MLRLQVFTDIGLGMFLQGLRPMEKTSSFFVDHLLRRISTSVYDSNRIPVGLGTVGHETFEIDILHSMHSHEGVEILPYD